MKIKQEVLERMKGRAKDIKPKIVEEMGVTKQAVDYWFAQNKENGWLTCKPVLIIIGKALNLSDEEILTESEISEPCESR